jgi:2-polyprenyl-6-hydroxyphenyl methylase/3-demethylubiquinone-9 3-methyltransferase
MADTEADAGDASTVDKEEIAHFSKLSAEWWDPKGPLMTLHKVTPFRMKYLKQQISDHFGRNPEQSQPLKQLRIVDVGCGGGLVTEPLARLGATVVGIDPSITNVKAARLHAAESGLDIKYEAITAEALAEAGNQYDVVLSLEVVEHVPDVNAFIAACGKLVRPGGLMIASTVNRTPLAYLLLIVAAEYVFRWIPRGTHSYAKLVTPDELTAALRGGGLKFKSAIGAKFNPLDDRWRFTRKLIVSYFMVAEKEAKKEAAV